MSPVEWPAATPAQNLAATIAGNHAQVVPKRMAGISPAPATAPKNSTVIDRTESIPFCTASLQGLSERGVHELIIRESDALEAEALACAAGFEAMGMPAEAELERDTAAGYANDSAASRRELAWLDRCKAAAAWLKDNDEHNRRVFASLKRTREERLARLAVKPPLPDLQALTDCVETAWLGVRQDPWKDRAQYFAFTISAMMEMTRLLSRLLHERAETAGDAGISFIMDGGLRAPHAAVVIERAWRKHLLALPEIPTAETMIESQIEFYRKLAGSVHILKVGTP